MKKKIKKQRTALFRICAYITTRYYYHRRKECAK